ncbi:MAG TPA: B12-binding domain-containing radical SAM protein, partial [Methylophaga sp.]|nr:B12-binding domain-containing radical SAM protein [Methylophaga sp.]
MSTTAKILLTTLNARYMHSAFGLRYLYANLGEHQSAAELIEFTIQEQPLSIAEKLLSYQPEVIGFSVYIWNVSEIEAVVALLKSIKPEIRIILGGPEVSHSPDLPKVCELADYVIAGPGEQDFRELCEKLLTNDNPATKYIDGRATPL